jgi:hypothetical protein
MTLSTGFPAAISILSTPANASTYPDGWASRSIPECVARLTALFAFQRELLRTEAAWMAGVPYWDAKQMIAGHVLAEAQMAEAVLKRLHELKAASAEHKQVAGVEELVRDLASARNGDEWLHGLYTRVKPWLLSQWEDYLRGSDPVMDAPTQDVIARLRLGLEEQIGWFCDFTPAFSDWEHSEPSEWLHYVDAVLAVASFSCPVFYSEAERPERPGNRPDFQGIATVRRDASFHVTQRALLPREGGTFSEKRFLVFYNHTQEMQFAESLGAIMFETAGMPWAFHHDLARHMADEVRHATMGQARLGQLGVRLRDIPMLTQHYEFRSNLDPLERFCLMTLVMEATAFERKRANVDLFEEQGDEVSACYESYDIRDEMLHANLGHIWVPILLRVYHDSRSVAELTEHCRGLIAQVISEYPANAANMIKR